MGFDFGGFISEGFGTLFNNMFAEERQNNAQAFSSLEADKAREWQEKMRASNYQTAVQDMKAAGLNPMLAYHQGGASTPTSSSPSGTVSGPGSSNFAGAMASASQVDVNDALAQRAREEADKIRAEAAEIRARTPTHAVSIERMNQEIAESRTRIENLMQQVRTGQATAANIHQQTQNLREELPRIRALTEQLHTLARLNKAQAIEAGARTTVSDAQYDEIRQRVRVNLPQIERAIKDLEQKAAELQMPRRGMEAAAHTSFIGALGAVLRALNPLSGLIGSTR